MLSLTSRKLRYQSGASMLALVMILAVFVIGAIGALTYEIARLEMAHKALIAATDASALAGAATLASPRVETPLSPGSMEEARANARRIALEIFQRNTVLNQLLSNARETTPLPTGAAAGESFIHVDFEQSASGSTGRVRVSSILGVSPAFGGFLHLGSVAIKASSVAGLPSIDLALVQDISNSMTADNYMVLVRRFWNDNQRKIVYRGKAGARHAFGGAATGVDPQWNKSKNGWIFSTALRSVNGCPDAGSPPGDFDPDNAQARSDATDDHVYTDSVVNILADPGDPAPAQISNIDPLDTTHAVTIDGYYFPNIATIVEALRGNLENTTVKDRKTGEQKPVFEYSRANTVLADFGVTPRDGYREAYMKAAKLRLMPFTPAIDAAKDFLDLMLINGDPHFGFVPFAPRPGRDREDTLTRGRIVADDVHYPKDIEMEFPLPQIAIDQSSNNRDEIVNNVLPKLVPHLGTHTAGGIRQGIKMLSNANNTRRGAKRVILLVTDGLPTRPDANNGEDDEQNEYAEKEAFEAASEARKAGIPIYCIGFLHGTHDPGVRRHGVEVMEKIVKKAGNGSQFYLATDIAGLRIAYETIARHLVALVE